MDLVVDYAVLFFVMNVCREKEKKISQRVNSRYGFVPASRCRAPHEEGLPTRECQASCRDEYINFSLCAFCQVFFFFMHTHSSDHLACFGAQMMPRSCESRQLAQGKMCMSASIVRLDDLDTATPKHHHDFMLATWLPNIARQRT
jgi:hypothetical protein